MLFESVTFVIDDIDKNAKFGLGSSLGVFEKTGKGAFMKFVDKETNDPVQEKPRVNVVPKIVLTNVILEALKEVPASDNMASPQDNVVR